MPATKAMVLEFLKQHRYAVLASSAAADGAPQAALVGFVVNDNWEFFFDTFDSTRKVANLRKDPRVALVIGGHTIGDERTVQVEGTAEVAAADKVSEFQERYFAILPDGRRRSKLPGIRYFFLRPRWLRYSDFNVAPAQIVDFDAAALIGR